MARRPKLKLPKKPSKKLPVLATRDGQPISSDKLRRAMKQAGKRGPKVRRDPKFKEVN